MSQTKETWATWVDEHYELLLSRATALFHGKTGSASDFLHDLLLELRRKWDQVEHPLAWISSTMRYRIADYFSKKQAFSPVLPENSQQPNDLTLHMDIEAAIQRLPAKLQIVLTLFLEGNSIPEIASKTKLSTDAVYQRLSRARKRLKDSLGGRTHEKNLQRLSSKNFTFSV